MTGGPAPTEPPAPSEPSALPGWLADPALTPLWSAVRERLERNGVQPRGALAVDRLDRAGRHALSGLLGRPVTAARVQVDLGALDAVLRERSGRGGLVAVVELVGGPLRNRPAERSARAYDREAPFVTARGWLATHPEVAGLPWVEDWLHAVRRSGLLARVAVPADAAIALGRALEVLARLTGPGPARSARTELAAAATGDAHGLDEGTVTAQLVLRALATAVGEPPPESLTARRALWERFEVTSDQVSSTCLVVGLRPDGDGSLAQRLRLAADAGAPVHLTGWDLRHGDLLIPPGTGVLVCENPRVLEAVAEALGGTVPVVCTSGMPALVAVDVLRRLSAADAALRYHGDLDWPGVAIANRLAAQVGARPWRMAAADYLAAARADGPPLVGEPVPASWDPELTTAMRRVGTAVHEEAVLDGLLDGLRDGLRDGLWRMAG